MISIQEFHTQFIERHDFEYEDLEFLPRKYTNILFKDIPEAWVCCLSDHLSSMKDLSKIVSICQMFGFPVIQYENDICDNDFRILKNMENSLLCIDADLHKQIGAMEALN